jgi:hypothetical protein
MGGPEDALACERSSSRRGPVPATTRGSSTPDRRQASTASRTPFAATRRPTKRTHGGPSGAAARSRSWTNGGITRIRLVGTPTLTNSSRMYRERTVTASIARTAASRRSVRARTSRK